MPDYTKRFIIEAAGQALALAKLMSDLRSKESKGKITSLLKETIQLYIKSGIPADKIRHQVSICIDECIFDYDDPEKGLIYLSKNEKTKLLNCVSKFCKSIKAKKEKEEFKDYEKEYNQYLEYITGLELIDDCCVKIIKKIKERIKDEDIKICFTEENFDEFGCTYIRLISQDLKKEFCVILVDTKSITYQSIFTKFHYPITVAKNEAGLETLMNSFIEKDLKTLKQRINDQG